MKYITTAARLRAALDEKGLRAQDLANKTGIGKASISQWINGRNKPSYQSAVKMARVLACDPYWLMGEDKTEPDYIKAYRNTVDFRCDGVIIELIKVCADLDDRRKDKLLAYAEGLAESMDE